MTDRRAAMLHVLTCVALWALIPVVSKTGQAEMDSHQFLFWSSVVSFLALGLAALLNGRGRPAATGGRVVRRGRSGKQHQQISKASAEQVGRRLRDWRFADWLKALALGFLGTYLYYILLYFGYAEARGLEVLVLQYAWPIFVVIFGVVLLRERLAWRRGGAIALGFLGVLLVLTKGRFADIHLDNPEVDLLVLLAALSFGLFSVLSKSVKLEPYGLNTVYFLSATLVSFISMLLFSEFALPAPSAVVPILVNGLFVNGFSYVFWLGALRKADASFIAPFVFLTPVLSALYLVIFFSEPVLPVYLIGLALVVTGGLLNRS